MTLNWWVMTFGWDELADFGMEWMKWYGIGLMDGWMDGWGWVGLGGWTRFTFSFSSREVACRWSGACPLFFSFLLVCVFPCHPLRKKEGLELPHFYFFSGGPTFLCILGGRNFNPVNMEWNEISGSLKTCKSKKSICRLWLWEKSASDKPKMKPWTQNIVRFEVDKVLYGKTDNGCRWCISVAAYLQDVSLVTPPLTKPLLGLSLSYSRGLGRRKGYFSWSDGRMVWFTRIRGGEIEREILTRGKGEAYRRIRTSTEWGLVKSWWMLSSQ